MVDVSSGNAKAGTLGQSVATQRFIEWYSDKSPALKQFESAREARNKKVVTDKVNFGEINNNVEMGSSTVKENDKRGGDLSVRSSKDLSKTVPIQPERGTVPGTVRSVSGEKPLELATRAVNDTTDDIDIMSDTESVVTVLAPTDLRYKIRGASTHPSVSGDMETDHISLSASSSMDDIQESSSIVRSDTAAKDQSSASTSKKLLKPFGSVQESDMNTRCYEFLDNMSAIAGRMIGDWNRMEVGDAETARERFMENTPHVMKLKSRSDRHYRALKDALQIARLGLVRINCALDATFYLLKELITQIEHRRITQDLLDDVLEESIIPIDNPKVKKLMDHINIDYHSRQEEIYVCELSHCFMKLVQHRNPVITTEKGEKVEFTESASNWFDQIREHARRWDPLTKSITKQ